MNLISKENQTLYINIDDSGKLVDTEKVTRFNFYVKK